MFDLATGEMLLEVNSPAELSLDEFGKTVAFVGTQLAIGAPYDRLEGTRAGAAYVFQGVPEPSGFTLGVLTGLLVCVGWRVGQI